MQYEWDEEKNQANYKKHKVRFQEAVTIFKDPNLVETYDQSHSEEEDRFIAIGFSERNRKLFVVFCERTIFEGEEIIRLISARRAK